jgi:hypothetical protein
MVGQEILGRGSEERAQQDHIILNEQFEKIQLVLQEIRELHKHTHSLIDSKINDKPEDH